MPSLGIVEWIDNETGTRHVVDTSKPGDPESVLQAVDTHSGGGYSRMHIGADKGAILDEVVRKANPRRVLELGAYFGYSAIRIARLMTAKDAELITLEIEAEHANAARELIALAGLAGKVTVVKGTAAASLKKLSGTFDLILAVELGRTHGIVVSESLS